MKLNFDLLVFDLDGTLIDSTLDLALAVNAARAQEGLPPLPIPQISSYVGNGAETLIRRSLGPEPSAEAVRQGLGFFLRYYREHMLDNTSLYPGVREALEAWRAAGAGMAVLTNKPERFSAELIAGLGLRAFFARIYGGNSFTTKKPNPYGLRVIMRELGFGPERTLMIGDSSVDVHTARNAGIACAGVSYGLRPEDFARHPPDILVGDMRELVARLEVQRGSKRFQDSADGALSLAGPARERTPK